MRVPPPPPPRASDWMKKWREFFRSIVLSVVDAKASTFQHPNKDRNSIFYDNCRNSRAFNMRTDTWILKFTRRVSERERAIRQFVIVKNKLMSVFNASVLLLIMNFVITLSKLSADPLGCRLVDPQLLWQCDDENSWSITGQTHKKVTSIC